MSHLLHVFLLISFTSSRRWCISMESTWPFRIDYTRQYRNYTNCNNMSRESYYSWSGTEISSKYRQSTNRQLVPIKRTTWYDVSIFVSECLYFHIHFLIFQLNRPNCISRSGEKISPIISLSFSEVTAKLSRSNCAKWHSDWTFPRCILDTSKLAGSIVSYSHWIRLPRCQTG